MQADELRFDEHYIHPLIMTFNLNISQTSSSIRLKQDILLLVCLTSLKALKYEREEV